MRMSLSSILELCEEHMSEGEYLQASNILKIIHNNMPCTSNEKIILFDNLKLKKIDDSGDVESTFDIFTIKGVIKRRKSEHGYFMNEEVICNFYGSDVNIKWENISKTLITYIKTNLWINFSLDGWLGNNTTYFSIKEYNKFQKTRHVMIFDDEDEDDEIYYDSGSIYQNYINHAVERIKEYIQIKLDP